MLELFFWPTVNGKKVVILLNELGWPFDYRPINIGRGDQLDPDFLKISPNGRMPALVDHAPTGGGEPLPIFESGAIMLYLAEKAGRFWSQYAPEKYRVAQWLLWQNANQGPKFGEQNHFRRAAESGKNGDLGYALRRFEAEVHRLYGVMNLGLHRSQYLAGEQYSIADMASYPWASTWSQRGIDLGEFPNVSRWLDELGARPAVQAAMALGPEFREAPGSVSAEEQTRRDALTSFQRAQPVPAGW